MKKKKYIESSARNLASAILLLTANVLSKANTDFSAALPLSIDALLVHGWVVTTGCVLVLIVQLIVKLPLELTTLNTSSVTVFNTSLLLME